jgi:hypothetical protein
MKIITLFTLLAILALFSCDKDCYICDIEKPDLIFLSTGVYLRWEYDSQGVFCGGLPESPDYIAPFGSDNFWDTYFEAERYTNCIPK